MNSKLAKQLRKATQLTQRQLTHHTMELKAYANKMPFHKRAQVAIAILLGRW